MLPRQWAQCGDTLIEVTIALTILSTVITSAYVVANRAYLTGQTARERSALAARAQQQGEALQTFRDETTWAEFQTGNSVKNFDGINSPTQSVDCDALGFGTPPRCFHMEERLVGGTTHWVPVAGAVAQSAGSGALVTIVVSAATSDPAAVKSYLGFDLYHTLDPRGGGVKNTGVVRLRLDNLDNVGK